MRITRELAVRFLSLGTLVLFLLMSPATAQVHSSGANGFEIRVSKSTKRSPKESCDAFVRDIGKWWSSDHTWSGKAENLAMDMDRCVLVERLAEGGFCRHMAVAHYEPGKLIRLTGGLGPLKEMGLDGTMTIRFTEKDGETVIDAKYVVHGYAPDGFSRLAPVVHQVLDQQFERLKNFSETGNPDPKDLR